MKPTRAAASSIWILALGATIVGAAPPPPEPSSPGVEIRPVDLGGELVSALAPGDDELFLLVAPVGEVDGARRLLRLTRGAAPSQVATELGGWTKSLAALELDGGPELVAAGLGRLAAFGPLAQPTGVERALVDHPGFDLRSLARERLRVGVDRELVTAEIGALRIWTPQPGGAVGLALELDLPFRIERERSGLRLAGPPVSELPRDAAGRRRFACGPEVVGSRLRVELVEQGGDAGDAWRRTETWSSLPGAEEVEESWLGSVDGAPALVARTQGATETNVFEDQLWRLFLLAPDRTRAGRAPALALSVDSKRWHDNQALLADADGDGTTDLLVARPEGLTGSDLVVEVYRGLGGGKFDRRSRRTDLDEAPSEWSLLADADGTGRPGLVAVGDGAVELHRFAREGRRALERAPALRALLPEGPKAEPAPGEKEPPRTRLDWLGAVPRAGRAPRLLVLATRDKSPDRLLVVDGPEN